jgi:organic hydroperoxide reductase OsmC/OhrA
MAEHVATIEWQRNGADFVDDKYSRAHLWKFDGGLSVPASASPHIVPEPMSVAGNVDPEEAFVASISSCHMLFFLAICARRGFVVDDYNDAAVGFLEKNADGREAITRVVLRPDARYSGKKIPTLEQLEKIHHRSHELCFIANSVRTEIVTEIVA